MCEPPDSHIPHIRPCPETFSGLPRLERLQLCEEVGLGSPSNTKWEPSPPSPHQDRFCLPENFSKLSCIGQDWSFGISFGINWIYLSSSLWWMDYEGDRLRRGGHHLWGLLRLPRWNGHQAGHRGNPPVLCHLQRPFFGSWGVEPGIRRRPVVVSLGDRGHAQEGQQPQTQEQEKVSLPLQLSWQVQEGRQNTSS